MLKIVKAYRETQQIDDLAKEVAVYLKQKIHCESVSIFLYDQISHRLALTYTTSTNKSRFETKTFGPHSPIFQMFEDKEDRILYSNSILHKYSDIDITFEGVDELFSIAFSRILDARNKPVGIIRAINKLDYANRKKEFENRSLNEIIIASNIMGSALTARFANKRITSFLDSVTHELLAPIAGVKNIAKFLNGYLSRKKLEPSEISRERISSNIKNILKESEQLILLVENLTMYSHSGRMGKRDKEACETYLFGDVLRDVIKKLRKLPGNSPYRYDKIIINDYHQWPKVRVDRNMMAQVFTNILHNSIKYSKPDPDEFLIKIYHKKSLDGGFKLFFEDNGIGIESSVADKIFLPGERGENAIAVQPTSTGIGLSTVKNLLTLHDMTISVRRLNSPTTFCITVPRKIVIWR